MPGYVRDNARSDDSVTPKEPGTVPEGHSVTEGSLLSPFWFAWCLVSQPVLDWSQLHFKHGLGRASFPLLFWYYAQGLRPGLVIYLPPFISLSLFSFLFLLKLLSIAKLT